jgi:ABC-type dipeptide/oligopeptide/nickel transport system permease component
MRRYVLARIGQSLIVLLGVFVLVFFMIRLTGDPAAAMMPREATPAQIEAFRHQMGFDRPLLVQFFDFVQRAAVGDFGRSTRYESPALPIILERLPATVQLATIALLIAVVIGVPLGLSSGARPNSVVDYVGRAIALFSQTVPNFWLALVMIIVFAVQFRLLPTSGNDKPLSFLMPAFVLGLPTLGRIVRLVRAVVLDIMGEDYIRTARSKGLPDTLVFYRHALRNALIPLVSVVGIQYGYMLGGSVIIESIFAWPGLGRMVSEAVVNRDFALVQAIAFFTSFTIIVLNLLTDLAYAFIDPRIRYE